MSMTASDEIRHFQQIEPTADTHPCMDRSRRVFHGKLIRMMGMTVRQYQEGGGAGGPSSHEEVETTPLR